jgi:hypothetical protein
LAEDTFSGSFDAPSLPFGKLRVVRAQDDSYRQHI